MLKNYLNLFDVGKKLLYQAVRKKKLTFTTYTSIGIEED